jgi:hypothetical protein
VKHPLSANPTVDQRRDTLAAHGYEPVEIDRLNRIHPVPDSDDELRDDDEE